MTTADVNKYVSNYLKTVQKLGKTLKSIESYEKSPPEHVNQIEKAYKDMKKIIPTLPAAGEFKQILDEWIIDFTPHVNDLKSEFEFKFGNRLSELLTAKGLTLQGRYPNFTVEFCNIEINADQGQAVIYYGNKYETLARSGNSPADIFASLLKARDELMSRQYNATDFLQKVYKAYLMTLSELNIPPDEDVPIMRILDKLVWMEQSAKFYEDPKKEYFKDYTRAQFSYDLYRLIVRDYQGKQLRMRTATVKFMQNKSERLWVLRGGGGHFEPYSHICFGTIKEGS